MSNEDLFDPLWPDAVKHVRKSGNTYISSLQRKLLIGYNRAARLMEAMEQERIVSPMKADGSRDVIHDK